MQLESGGREGAAATRQQPRAAGLGSRAAPKGSEAVGGGDPQGRSRGARPTRGLWGRPTLRGDGVWGLDSLLGELRPVYSLHTMLGEQDAELGNP